MVRRFGTAGKHHGMDVRFVREKYEQIDYFLFFSIRCASILLNITDTKKSVVGIESASIATFTQY